MSNTTMNTCKGEEEKAGSQALASQQVLKLVAEHQLLSQLFVPILQSRMLLRGRWVQACLQSAVDPAKEGARLQVHQDPTEARQPAY